jgi:NitT/TauT family transport system ATP-binding protein
MAARELRGHADLRPTLTARTDDDTRTRPTRTTDMPLITKDLSKEYETEDGGRTLALKGLDLRIEDGEAVTIIGQSGCGKSTLLHLLGGLIAPTSGVIEVEGKVVDGPNPELAAFVFQDYTLLPWRTIVDNASIGLRFAGIPKAQARAKGMEMLSLVGLTEYANAYPHQLSGGMQQRVAVARAMAMNPKILLMDEPFGALDEQTRRHLGFEMSSMLSDSKSTIVLVTHSLDEAILWADRVIVLSARPGQVMREIRIPAPRPRRADAMREPWFSEIRTELFELLETGPAAAGNAVDGDVDVDGGTPAERPGRVRDAAS